MIEIQDTINLLKECDSGSKMAVSSIDDVLDKVQCGELKDLLMKSKSHHEKLGNELHSALLKHNTDDKDPNIMAKSMSWVKTHMKLGMEQSDSTVADLMTDGCNMGVKSLYKYMNQYPNADEESHRICKSLIEIEEELRSDLSQYL